MAQIHSPKGFRHTFIYANDYIKGDKFLSDGWKHPYSRNKCDADNDLTKRSNRLMIQREIKNKLNGGLNFSFLKLLTLLCLMIILYYLIP